MVPLFGVVALAQLVVCASERPLYFSYYSPLLGGTAGAREVLLVGWGEGLAPVAEYLDALPSKPRPWSTSLAASESVMSTLSTAKFMTTPDGDSRLRFGLAYVNDEQRGFVATPHPEDEPLVTVRIHGVDYARLYALDAAARAELSALHRRAGHGRRRRRLNAPGYSSRQVRRSRNWAMGG